MTSDVKPICALCGNPASNKCIGCKSDTTSRYYCDKACQVKDWPKHKKACKHAQNLHLEKALERVAEILRQAYYQFRKRTWNASTMDVVVGRNFVELHNKSIMERTNFFVDFPQHLVPNEEIERVVLFATACREPLVWMHDLISALLKGLDVKVEEITVRPKDIRRVVIIESPSDPPTMNWPCLFHEILRIKSTKTRKQWVVDVTGEQYGISGSALWPWDHYERAHTVDAPTVHPFGWNRALATGAKGFPDQLGLWLKIGTIATEHLNAAIKTWTNAHKLSVADIIALDESGYKKSKGSLLKAMNDAIRSFVAANRFDAEFQAAKDFEQMNPIMNNKAVSEGFESFFQKFREEACTLLTTKTAPGSYK